jgi:hypothetical protein
MRSLVLIAVLLAATPALAQESSSYFRLSCQADDPKLMDKPLLFSFDLSRGEATETASGKLYGVLDYRDGFGLYDPAEGRSAVAFRIDGVKGRFVRVDTPTKIVGTCETVAK